jgi:hypothetical protein
MSYKAAWGNNISFLCIFRPLRVSYKNQAVDGLQRHPIDGTDGNFAVPYPSRKSSGGTLDRMGRHDVNGTRLSRKEGEGGQP